MHESLVPQRALAGWPEVNLGVACELLTVRPRASVDISLKRADNAGVGGGYLLELPVALPGTVHGVPAKIRSGGFREP